MNRFLLLLIGSLWLSCSVAGAHWDLGDNYVGAALAETDKAVDEKYNGTKIILNGQYALKRVAGETSERRSCCSLPSRPEYFYGLLDGNFQFGLDGTGLEFTRLGFTPWAVMLKPGQQSTGKIRAKRDILEVGAVQFVSDDPLAVDSYLEVSIGHAGRVGTLKWSANSPFTVKLGVQVSAGWAWAESADPAYSKVSNPFAGIYGDLSIEHERWGGIYADVRFVNGFSFSSPARGHPTVREARTRFGYFKPLPRCLSLDLFLEKRSFNFEESGLPGRYTKSGALGADLSCHFR